MKRMKRMFSLMLVLALAAAMLVPAHALSGGSITINNIPADANATGTTSVYEIYRLLDLDDYDTVAGSYAYKINEKWKTFFLKTDTEGNIVTPKAIRTEIQPYFQLDENNSEYIVWAGSTDANVAKEEAGVFAQLALAHVKALKADDDPSNDIVPTKSSSNSSDMVLTDNPGDEYYTGVFSGLELGYYLVDSNVGALCGLTTTRPEAVINAKNGHPTIKKRVQEDGESGDADKGWGETNTAEIGDTVQFYTMITVEQGAENFVLHDKMSEGLTFSEIVKIEYQQFQLGSEYHTATDDDYKVYIPGQKLAGAGAEDPAVIQDECDFEIHFENSFVKDLTVGDKIHVYYSAILNDKAVVGDQGNPNTTWLDYGEGHKTTESETVTYTYAADIVKTDKQDILLDGAEFQLYHVATGDNPIQLIEKKNGAGKITGYRLATQKEIEDSSIEKKDTIVVAGGVVRLEGLEQRTYYLEETAAPTGYHELSGRHAFTINNKNLDATFTDGRYSENSGVHIINGTGSILPETGGIGTTIFYLVGGGLMIAAVVLLITKKRMSEQK